MARIIKIINNSGKDGDWVNQTIPDGESFTIPVEHTTNWVVNPTVFADIGSGKLVVNDGTNNITDPIKGWNYLEGVDLLPRSDLDKTKIAVHSSPKPTVFGKTSYAVWVGAGDVIADGNVGEDSIIELVLTPGTGVVTKDVKFDPVNGKCWVHEAYLKWENGGPGDFMTGFIVAPPTPVQTVASLSVIIEDNWLKPVIKDATHGFADPTQIYLIPRSFSHDGWWDYDGVSLTPNLAGTGNYHISDIERNVHKFVNKIPTRGTIYDFVVLTSDETVLLPIGYFIRVEAYNVSDTSWFATVIIEMYRERTVVP